jgi:hypothetical protein
MELHNQSGDLFTRVDKVNNVYPAKLEVVPPRAGLAAWTAKDDDDKATHRKLAE